MIRLLIPFIFIGAAVGLFKTCIDPTYKDIRSLQVQINSYDEALSKAQELRKVRDDLLKTRDSFAPGDIEKLAKVLPENVDNIRLIIDIGNIAARHNLMLSTVDLGDLSQSKEAKLGAGTPDMSAAIGFVDVGFSVTSTYDTFLTFVADLEHSLRLLDIQKLSFTAAPTGLVSYKISLRTYWLH